MRSKIKKQNITHNTVVECRSVRLSDITYSFDINLNFCTFTLSYASDVSMIIKVASGQMNNQM